MINLLGALGVREGVLMTGRERRIQYVIFHVGGYAKLPVSLN